MLEMCISAGIEHEIEFVVAAFGSCCFKCKLCGLFFDEYEDGLTG